MKVFLCLCFYIWFGYVHAQGLEQETLEDIAKHASPALEQRGILPSSVDLSALLPAPSNQGPSDACTSFAVTYAAGSAALRLSRSELRGLMLSPAYTYPIAGGTSFCRSTTKISQTLDALRDKGALPLEEYRFDPGWCARVPTEAERTKALRFRIAGWHYIKAGDVDQVKGQLALRHPVIFGMQIGPAFFSQHGDGVITNIEQGTGTSWHAMVLVGYDDGRRAFRLINSFGQGWGDGGYAWISYDAWKPQEDVAFVIDTP